MAKVSVNLLTDVFGPATARLEFPELVKYVRMPASRKDIWPYHALFAILEEGPTAGLASKNHGIVKPATSPSSLRVSWLRTASGVLAMPLRRDDKAANSEACDIVNQAYETLRKNESIIGLAATYSADDSRKSK